MEVGNMQTAVYMNQSHRALHVELIIDTKEIESILYLGMKGVDRRAAQAEEIDNTNHTVDTFV